MLLNGSAVNVVAVNAIDKIVVALQGLSQFSTASASDLRLVASMIAASSINYSGSGDVSPAVVVQGSAGYVINNNAVNRLTVKLAGESNTSVYSNSTNKLSSNFVGNSSSTFNTLSSVTPAMLLTADVSNCSITSSAINTLVAKLAGLSGTTISSNAASKLSSTFAGNSSSTFNTLGIITAAMVLAAEGSSYSVGSSGNTPKLVSALQALSQVLVGSEASNRLTTGTGSGVASFSVVADSRAPISRAFYSGLASYALGSNADNLLVSGLSGVSNIAIGTDDASVYTFMSVDGSSGFSLNSESTVYVNIRLGSSGVEFTVGSAGSNILTIKLDGLSSITTSREGSYKLVAKVSGVSSTSVTSDSSVLVKALLDSVVNYVVNSVGGISLVSTYAGVADTNIESNGKAHVVKFSLTVDDESAYMVEPINLVYNIESTNNMFAVEAMEETFTVQYDDGTHRSSR